MTEEEHRQRMDYLAQKEARRLFNEYVEELEKKRYAELHQLLLDQGEHSKRSGKVIGFRCSDCRHDIAVAYPWKYPCPYCGHRFGS